MPGEDRIDSYVDLESTGRETKAFLSQLDAVYQVYKLIKDTKITLKASDNFGETTKQTQKLSAAMKEQERISKALETTAVKLAAQETVKAKALAITQEALKKNTQELKNQIREQNAAEGSIEKLRATLIRLNKEYDNLTKAEREASSGTGLKKQINDVVGELKKLEGETGRFQRNVGNYANSFASALGTVQKSLDNIRKDINSGNFGGQQLDQLKQKEQLLVNITGQLGKEFTTTKQQSKAFQEAAAQLGIALGQNSQEFQSFKDQVGESVDSLNDIRDSIKLAASDTKQLDKLIGAATAITGAFSVAQGAAALFGGENKELQQTFVRLQAAMTILNGLQAIQNELKNKDSILSKLRNFLTGEQTKMLKVQAAATEANALATKGAAAQTRAWGVALKGIGIGLLLTLIPIVVSAMNSFSTKTKEVDKALEGMGETASEIADTALEELDGAIKSLNDELGLTPTVVERARKSYILLREEVEKLKKFVDKNSGSIFNPLAAGLAQGLGKGIAEREKKLSDLLLKIKETENLQRIKLDSELLDAIIERNKTIAVNEAELSKDQATRQLNLLKKQFDQRIATEKEFTELSTKELQKVRDAELIAINENLKTELAAAADNNIKRQTAQNNANKDRILAERNYQDAVTALFEEAEKRRRVISSQTIQGIAEVQKDSLSAMAEALDKIGNNEFGDNLKAASDELIAKFKEIQNQLKDLRKDLALTFVDAFVGIAGSAFDARKNAIQEEINKLEEKKQKEIEVANATIQNEQDKAAAITVIEARAAGEKEKFERQKKQVDIQKARFEKAAAILNIGIDTIQKVAVIRTNAAVMRTNPLLPPGVGAILSALALTQIPLVLATGAISAAAIAAKPIPKFKYGRTGGKATPAIVGDGGIREVITNADGTNPMLTPATDTYVHLQENAKVFPSEEAYRKALVNGSIKLPGNARFNEHADGSMHVVQELRSLKNTVANKRELHFHWNNGELQMSIKNGIGKTRYIQSNIFD